jgi:hypothetical protein
MLRFITGIFIILHGLVYMFYFGQSRRLFELEAAMIWPDGSWIFSKLLGTGATRSLASVACVLAAIGFVAGGIAILFGLAWWRPVVIATAVFSSLAFLLFWDGTLHKLDVQGGISILINLAILLAVLVFQWPKFDF